MPIEGEQFLSEKYQDLAGSKPVEIAAKRKVNQGEKGPADKFELIQNYLNHLDSLIEDEPGWERFKLGLINEYSIDVRDEKTLTKIAHGLFESEKKLARERGQGVEVEQLERQSESQILDKYRNLTQEKHVKQEETLSSWLDYLKQNDAEYPTWFRYFVIRSLGKLGTLDKEKGKYSLRTQYTVAPFPELNSEALGWTYQRLVSGLPADLWVPQDEDALRAKDRILSNLQKKDFAGLYVLGLAETSGELDKSSIDGEWRTYPQYSNYKKLESDLAGKGTGWCTATGSAYAHLEGGDFHVFFTKGKSDQYTEPRVAIRMENGQVSEVRGINQRQELEPILIDEAKKRYAPLPGGEKFQKKSADMKKVTEIYAQFDKQNNQWLRPLTKDDITFLYEINVPIEGFGYQKDPRIAELRATRDPNKDILVILECSQNQIAHASEEINETTKAYVGEWNVNVFKTIKDYPNIQHFYESFPDKKIFMQTLKTDENIDSPQSAEGALEGKNIYLSDWVKDILSKTKFSSTSQNYDLVRFSVGQLGLKNGATTEEIFRKAEEMGLEPCPAEVGPQLRLQYEGKEYFWIAMEPIIGRIGYPFLFSLDSYGSRLKLNTFSARPTDRWNPGCKFVFRRRKLKTE